MQRLDDVGLSYLLRVYKDDLARITVRFESEIEALRDIIVEIEQEIQRRVVS